MYERASLKLHNPIIETATTRYEDVREWCDGEVELREKSTRNFFLSVICLYLLRRWKDAWPKFGADGDPGNIVESIDELRWLPLRRLNFLVNDGERPFSLSTGVFAMEAAVGVVVGLSACVGLCGVARTVSEMARIGVRGMAATSSSSSRSVRSENVLIVSEKAQRTTGGRWKRDKGNSLVGAGDAPFS